MKELTKKRARLIAKMEQKKGENDLIEQELSGLEVTVAERAHIHEAIGSINTSALRRQKTIIGGSAKNGTESVDTMAASVYKMN